MPQLKIPSAATKTEYPILCATIKTQHNQIKKKKRFMKGFMKEQVCLMQLKKLTNVYTTIRMMQNDRRVQIRIQTLFLRAGVMRVKKLPVLFRQWQSACQQ